MERLLAVEETFVGEYIEAAVEVIKQKCIDEGLDVIISAKEPEKYVLVWRLFQAHFADMERPTKRARTSPKPPSVKQLQQSSDAKAYYGAVQKLIDAHANRKYNSHRGLKQHVPDVVQLMIDLMTGVLSILDFDAALTLKCTRAVFAALRDHFPELERESHPTHLDHQWDALSRLNQVMDKLAPTMKDEQKTSTAAWMNELHALKDPYTFVEDPSCLQLKAIANKNCWGSYRGGEHRAE